ncbi:MAG: DUF4935 domain-containing protein [Nostoc sp. NMS1]|uniref:PIN domain-containing protein n=1 Tax=Nostoc sp. NMS1 TaxID=2815388 RepID=UPI0025DFD674|nr:PIN domain-containing protein [Nostoc sp. NMS1]MBN3906747.1 DUF4935 domain-containing protein [Nostoc sp. NMS1]
MHLFIDTNIFLSFYHFRSDDLEELKKLIVLLRRQEVILLLTEQVIDEFNRNRENKIADAIKHLKEQRLNLQFPQLCKDYEEYQRLQEYQKQYDREHKALLNKITEDVKNRTLKADMILEDIFMLATKLETTDDNIKNARLRIDIGNPPGKNGSLGDAINWETLLSNLPNQENISFITDDKDYCSPLKNETFNEFLLEEWRKKKRAKILYHKQISSFFKENFPAIKLASELEKDFLIQELANSSNFVETHEIVAKLSRYIDFTSAQLNRIVDAAVSNNQISWIIPDDDVNEFLTSVITGKEHCIDKNSLQELKELIKNAESVNSDV